MTENYRRRIALLASFIEAQKLISDLMNSDSFLRFRQSSLFIKAYDNQNAEPVRETAMRELRVI